MANQDSPLPRWARQIVLLGTACLIVASVTTGCGSSSPQHIDGVGCVLVKTSSGVKVLGSGDQSGIDSADRNQESASGHWQDDVCVQDGPWESFNSLNPNGPRPPDCTIVDNQTGDSTPGWYNSNGVCTPNGN